MSQPDLAERLDVSPSTISNWEREHHPPDWQYINRLVLAVGIAPEELLEAMGIHMSSPPQTKLPKELVDAWPRIPPRRRGLASELWLELREDDPNQYDEGRREP
jgi:transcriptional regulator with XRE-family HTH domain